MAIIFTYTLYLKNLTTQNNVKYPGKQKEVFFFKSGGILPFKEPRGKNGLNKSFGRGTL